VLGGFGQAVVVERARAERLVDAERERERREVARVELAELPGGLDRALALAEAQPRLDQGLAAGPGPRIARERLPGGRDGLGEAAVGDEGPAERLVGQRRVRSPSTARPTRSRRSPRSRPRRSRR
jgi:hypothetical protein